MDKKGSKFNYDSYSFKNDQTKPFTQTFNQRNCKRTCICSNYNENKCFECFKCKEKTHNCTKVFLNRPQIPAFQCMSCLARSMDLIFQPQTICLETFFRTENIFEKSNIINFQFQLKFQETKFPIDVRCFKGNKIELVWPMQGQFYLNGSTNPLFVLKPLKSNSNRKNRKEDNFLIQPQLLKQGPNILTFKIPRLQKGKFIESFQYQQIGIYYLAVYSVKQFSNQQVLNVTQRQRRHQKGFTLSLFHLGDEQLPKTQKQKVRLIDPYTCERIKFPVRGRYCKHIGAVCLLTYISFQKRSRSWKCPICAVQVNSFLNEPYLDVWMYELLKENERGESVVLYANGMYEWQSQKQQVVGLDDSDDSEEQKVKQKDSIQIQKIVEQQPLILALENIDLESNPQHIETVPQQNVDLCEYEYVIEYNDSNPIEEVLKQNNLNQGRQIVQTQMIDTQTNHRHQQDDILVNDQQINLENNANLDFMQDEAFMNQQYPEISNVVIDEQEQFQQESRMSSSGSELEHLGAQNSFVPPSIISNIIPTKNTQSQQKKPINKQPEIYSAELINKKHFINKNAIQNASKIINQKIIPDKIQKDNVKPLLRQKNQVVNKISIPNKNLSQNLQNTSSLRQIKVTKLDENKRILQRPTFPELINIFPKPKSLSLPNQKNSSINIGKVNRKNIQVNQAKQLKAEPKLQYHSFRQSNSLSVPKILKRQDSQQVQKMKPPKIKTLTFHLISHNKFVKTYCNVPIPSLTRKMNDDMKRLFRNILEVV